MNLITLFLIVFLTVFGVLVAIIIVNITNATGSMNSLPTFDEYLAQNPNCKKGSRVCCNRCGGTNVHLWWLWGPQHEGPKKHICRTCGTDLWRS